MALASRLTITPATVTHYPIVLTALTPIIHGDPDHQGKSNTKPFRRVTQLVSVSNPGKPVQSHQLDRLIQAAPYPRSIGEYLETLSPQQYFAVALLVRFLAHYNGKGLLDGMERYTRLADHLAQSASRSDNLPAWWSDLADALQVGGHSNDDPHLLSLLAMPHALAGHVLRILCDEAETTIVFARAWHDDEKLMDAGYAEKAAKTHNQGGYADAAYTTADLPAPAPTIARTVPNLAGNALRNRIRVSADQHLRDRIQIGAYTIPSITHMLENGGGIEKSAAAPYDEIMLGIAACNAYPSLELLGGATGLFLLPTSMLSTPGWLVCTENHTQLRRYSVTPHHPAESLITVATHVRGGNDMMPHAAEQLIKGSQILIDYTLRYGASHLAHGAFAAALTWWHDHTPVIGGVGAQGFGRVAFDLPTDPDFLAARQDYEDYLAAHQDRLRLGLLDGTFTTGKVICGKGSAEDKKKGKATKGKAAEPEAGGLFDAAEQ